MDDASKLDPAVLSAMFSSGFMGIEVGTEYGGSGLNFMSAILAVEELAKVDPSVSVVMDVHSTLVSNVITKWGTEAQRAAWLPRLSADTLGSFALSEAGSGSDAFALRTRAVRSPDGGYTLNGSKMWITNSSEAGVFLVMANENPEAGYKGITCFIVPAGTPGLTVGKPESKLGIRASSTCPLSLDNVVLPPGCVVGTPGQGYKLAISMLNEGRIGIGAQMVGLAQGAFDCAVPYTMRRTQFGKPVGTFQGMEHQYAQAATEIEAARLLVYNAARRKMAGESFVKEAAMAKLYASQVAERVSSKAIEWMGGVGFTKDMGAEKFYRDCKIGAIYEGTSNIQLSAIAKIIQSEMK